MKYCCYLILIKLINDHKIVNKIIKIGVILTISICIISILHINHKQNKKIKSLESYAGDWEYYCASKTELEELEERVIYLEERVEILDQIQENEWKVKYFK